MPTRREFLVATSAAPALLRGGVTARDRVDRAINGQDLDRPPFSLWHHFGLEKFGPERHAEATIAFHRQHGTDLPLRQNLDGSRELYVRIDALDLMSLGIEN